MEHSNKYIFIYSIIMVVVVAVSSTVVAVQLKPAQEDNIRIEKMQNILTSVNVPIAGVPKKQIIEVYHKYITTAIGININGDVVEQDSEKVFAIDLANEFKKPAEKQILPALTATLDGGDTALYSLAW